MITFSLLEKKGNLGNQLFQIASVIGIAKANNQPFAFPTWSYAGYFAEQLPLMPSKHYEHRKEASFSFQPLVLDAGDYDLEGWFQSERYFDIEETRRVFTFNPLFLNEVRSRFEQALKKKTILI